MKIRSNILAIAIIALSFFACDPSLEKVYVESVEVLPYGSHNKTNLLIKVNLPSPAYEFDHSRVKINLKGSQIDITPKARFDKDKTVPQILVPFKDIVSLRLPSGKYEVRLHGIDGIKKQIIEIDR